MLFFLDSFQTAVINTDLLQRAGLVLDISARVIAAPLGSDAQKECGAVLRDLLVRSFQNLSLVCVRMCLSARVLC